MKTFTAPQLAREMKLPPKRVRAILRQNGIKRPGGRWEFPMSEKARFKAMVRGARKRATVARPRSPVVAKRAARKVSNEERASLH